MTTFTDCTFTDCTVSMSYERYQEDLARERRKGAEMMREACIVACQTVVAELLDPEEWRGKDVPHRWQEAWRDQSDGAGDCVGAIRALPLPGDPQ